MSEWSKEKLDRLRHSTPSGLRYDAADWIESKQPVVEAAERLVGVWESATEENPRRFLEVFKAAQDQLYAAVRAAREVE